MRFLFTIAMLRAVAGQAVTDKVHGVGGAMITKAGCKEVQAGYESASGFKIDSDGEAHLTLKCDQADENAAVGLWNTGKVDADCGHYTFVANTNTLPDVCQLGGATSLKGKNQEFTDISLREYTYSNLSADDKAKIDLATCSVVGEYHFPKSVKANNANAPSFSAVNKEHDLKMFVDGSCTGTPISFKTDMTCMSGNFEEMDGDCELFTPKDLTLNDILMVLPGKFSLGPASKLLLGMAAFAARSGSDRDGFWDLTQAATGHKATLQINGVKADIKVKMPAGSCYTMTGTEPHLTIDKTDIVEGTDCLLTIATVACSASRECGKVTLGTAVIDDTGLTNGSYRASGSFAFVAMIMAAVLSL